MPRQSSKGRTRPTEIVVGPAGRGASAAAQGLERPQACALEAIILGKSMQEAADAVGVDRATLYRWRMNDPRFMHALASWRREIAGPMDEPLPRLFPTRASAATKLGDVNDRRYGTYENKCNHLACI